MKQYILIYIIIVVFIIIEILIILNTPTKPHTKIIPGKIYYEYNIIHHYDENNNNPSLFYNGTDTIPVDTIYYP